MPTCRDCQSPIGFELTASGKKRPINADGSDHFVSCAARAARRGPRPPDDECLTCGSGNVRREPGKGPHYGAVVCNDCQAHRWLRQPEIVQ